MQGRSTSDRLPDLGPRGEGWFAGQVLLMALVAAAGLAGPAWDGPARVATTIAGALLIALAGAIGFRAFADLRGSFTPLPRPVEGGGLVETGIYGLVRHPMYLGVVTAGLGWSLASASVPALVGTAILLAFLDLKSRREEAWLLEAYPGYEAYRRRTSRFLPSIH